MSCTKCSRIGEEVNCGWRIAVSVRVKSLVKMLVHRSWGERMTVQASNIQLCPNPKCGADVSLSANNCPKCGTPQRQLLGRGTVLQGRYRIDGIRGSGGFGAVYRATDLQTNGLVAIKENHLVDFGVAKVLEAVDPNRPRSSSIVAWTDGYSPPEQYQSGVEVNARADQYALAATMVFALTGQIPDDAFTRMEKFRNGELTLPPKPADAPRCCLASH